MDTREPERNERQICQAWIELPPVWPKGRRQGGRRGLLCSDLFPAKGRQEHAFCISQLCGNIGTAG